MYSFKIIQLLALYLLITQVFADVVVKYIPYDDGTYGWHWAGTTPTLTPTQIKEYARREYIEMAREARELHHMTPREIPKVMAAVYMSTQHGGYMILASSLKGAREGVPSMATAQYVADQHNHGNCAEMHALALASAHRIKVAHGEVAAYGLQGDRETFMHPCQDRRGPVDNTWGCSSFCRQEGLADLTKRSRIEGKSISEELLRPLT